MVGPCWRAIDQSNGQIFITRARPRKKKNLSFFLDHFLGRVLVFLFSFINSHLRIPKGQKKGIAKGQETDRKKHGKQIEKEKKKDDHPIPQRSDLFPSCLNFRLWSSWDFFWDYPFFSQVVLPSFFAFNTAALKALHSIKMILS